MTEKEQNTAFNSLNGVLVSVIVPIYNTEKFLGECIESIIGQTLSAIEIILVDDGSTDNSGMIADQFAASDNRIFVIHKSNGGLSSARNAGLAIAQGKYISFIDADDWIDRDMLESMYLEADKNQSDITVSGIIIEYPAENRKVVINAKNKTASQNKPEFGNIFWELHQLNIFNYAWNKFYRTDFVRQHQLTYLADGVPAEDFFFNMQALKLAESFVVLDKAYYHYLRRDDTNILSNYHGNLITIEKRRWDALKDCFVHFKMTENKYNAYLDRQIVDAASRITINLFKKKAPFQRKERTEIIRTHIFRNKDLAEKIKSYSAVNFYEKIFVLLFSYSNAVIMERSYKLLFSLKSAFGKRYASFRNKELKKQRGE